VPLDSSGGGVMSGRLGDDSGWATAAAELGDRRGTGGRLGDHGGQGEVPHLRPPTSSYSCCSGRPPTPNNV